MRVRVWARVGARVRVRVSTARGALRTSSRVGALAKMCPNCESAYLVRVRARARVKKGWGWGWGWG